MSDNLSQEDIDKLLSGASNFGQDFGMPQSGHLKQEEIDTLLEIYSVTMSASSKTLTEVLGNKVSIANPQLIEFEDISEVMNNQENSVLVQIKYLSGLDATVILLLKEKDSAVIADLMMGGTGELDDYEIGELQLSAAGEAMNQMMGAAATNLASVLNRLIDISPPDITRLTPDDPLDLSNEFQNSPIIGIVFKFTVGDVIDSEMVQLFSVEAAKNQVSMFLGTIDNFLSEVNPTPQKGSGGSRMFGSSQESSKKGAYDSQIPQQPVTVQPARFTSFDSTSSMYGMENQNLDLVLDVGLKLSVELGRAELPIKKVLELTRGSVIELDKIAGEPVDLLANGKLIAKGEVVVIEDNFGLRITSIISPADRIKNL